MPQPPAKRMRINTSKLWHIVQQRLNNIDPLSILIQCS